MPFDYDGFLEWLKAKKYDRATAMAYIYRARKCHADGAMTDEAINEMYAARGKQFRSRSRKVMRRYREYLKTGGEV